jgi:hypothetical protein
MILLYLCPEVKLFEIFLGKQALELNEVVLLQIGQMFPEEELGFIDFFVFFAIQVL